MLGDQCAFLIVSHLGYLRHLPKQPKNRSKEAFVCKLCWLVFSDKQGGLDRNVIEPRVSGFDFAFTRCSQLLLGGGVWRSKPRVSKSSATSEQLFSHTWKSNPCATLEYIYSFRSEHLQSNPILIGQLHSNFYQKVK